VDETLRLSTNLTRKQVEKVKFDLETGCYQAHRMEVRQVNRFLARLRCGGQFNIVVVKTHKLAMLARVLVCQPYPVLDCIRCIAYEESTGDNGIHLCRVRIRQA
jgi:hypothetical protein